ncbi:MAG: signal peptidase I [Clostridiales bacterium]|nr:signal peptidase I [Clostridiales bacterium]
MTNKDKFLKDLGSWFIVLVVALLLAAFVNSQIFAMATVKEISMQNTLFADQVLVVNRLSYRNKIPQKGDIIIFYQSREIDSFFKEFGRSISSILPFMGPDEEESRDRLVKRVIATPGDEIDIRDGKVYVNGEQLNEPYVKGITPEGIIKLPLIVEENQLFVMGDNREHSRDSRHFGCIDVSHVEGKASLRLFPFSKFGKIK